MKSMEIRHTTDYTIFNTMIENRAVNRRRVNKAKASISKIGYLEASPIIVNEKHEIVDGQARFEALKELGMPVPYVIQNGLGAEECRVLNSNAENWTALDYAHSYAKSGNASYIRLAELMDRFDLPVGTLVALTYRLVSGDGGGSKIRMLKAGEFELSKERAVELIDAIEWLKSFDNLQKLKHVRSSTWLTCLYFVSERDGVTRKELARRINHNAESLPSNTQHPKVILEWLSAIWNKNRPKGEKRHFEIEYYEQ